MRKLLFVGAVVLSAAALLGAQTQSQTQTQNQLVALSVNTGLWQVTMTSTVSGFPPNTSNYKSCVKQADLAKYPFTDPKDKCTWTVQTSTGTQMNATGTCMPANMGTVNFTMQLHATDSQDVKGTGTLTLNGPTGPMNGNYSATAKWVSDTCPAKIN